MSQQESGPSQRTQPQLLTMPVFEIPWVKEFSVLISCEYTKKEHKKTWTTLQTSPTLSNLASPMVPLQPYCIKKILQVLSRISIL